MPAITAENAPIIQSLLQSVNKEKPEVGSTVKVINGKHNGLIGIVKKHMRSKFVNPYRYGNELQHHMIDARGRWGYIVLIETPSGDTTWINAQYVINCCTKEW